MPNPGRETDVRSSDPLNARVRLELTKMDLALMIDALLQAEMTLPLIDRRHKALRAIESLRAQQLSLANRLEELLAGCGLASESGKAEQVQDQGLSNRQSQMANMSGAHHHGHTET